MRFEEETSIETMLDILRLWIIRTAVIFKHLLTFIEQRVGNRGHILTQIHFRFKHIKR